MALIKATVKQMLNVMNEIAPPELCEEWDNPGLLIGRADAYVTAIMLCVDATESVIREARECGAQLIISHHPLMFHAIKHVRDDEPEGHVICELIRNNMNLIAAHTNLDAAHGGVNDALCETLGLTCVSAPEPFLRVGSMNGTLDGIAQFVRDKLDTRVMTYGPGDAHIERVALCSGAGGSEIRAAKEYGAQLFITGEMKHNELIEARQMGLSVICAGHFETERVVLSHLAGGLQTRFSALQYKANIFISKSHPLA